MLYQSSNFNTSVYAPSGSDAREHLQEDEVIQRKMIQQKRPSGPETRILWFVWSQRCSWCSTPIPSGSDRQSRCVQLHRGDPRWVIPGFL